MSECRIHCHRAEIDGEGEDASTRSQTHAPNPNAHFFHRKQRVEKDPRQTLELELEHVNRVGQIIVYLHLDMDFQREVWKRTLAVGFSFLKNTWGLTLRSKCFFLCISLHWRPNPIPRWLRCKVEFRNGSLRWEFIPYDVIHSNVQGKEMVWISTEGVLKATPGWHSIDQPTANTFYETNEITRIPSAFSACPFLLSTLNRLVTVREPAWCPGNVMTAIRRRRWKKEERTRTLKSQTMTLISNVVAWRTQNSYFLCKLRESFELSSTIICCRCRTMYPVA